MENLKHSHKCLLCRSNKVTHPHLSYHRFPKEQQRFAKWLEAIAQGDGINVPTTTLSSRVVCSHHFTCDCFRPHSTSPTLWPHAIPNTNLAGSSKIPALVTANMGGQTRSKVSKDCSVAINASSTSLQLRKVFNNAGDSFGTLTELCVEERGNPGNTQEISVDQTTHPVEMSVTGLVLARGGSKGVKNKNLVLLDKKPLLLRCLETMHEAKCFSNVWVSTDDDKIAECAERGGAKVHRRAKYTATDGASSLCAVQEFLQYHPEICVVCLVQCTSPFLQATYLRTALDKIQTGCDSVFSVTRRHLFRWSEGEQTYPQNLNPEQRPRRQDWSGDLYENGMFYISRVNLIHQGLLQGGRCGYVEIPQEDSLDIDSPFDVIIAQEWIRYCQKEIT